MLHTEKEGMNDKHRNTFAHYLSISPLCGAAFPLVGSPPLHTIVICVVIVLRLTAAAKYPLFLLIFLFHRFLIAPKAF